MYNVYVVVVSGEHIILCFEEYCLLLFSCLCFIYHYKESVYLKSVYRFLNSNMLISQRLSGLNCDCIMLLIYYTNVL